MTSTSQLVHQDDQLHLTKTPTADIDDTQNTDDKHCNEDDDITTNEPATPTTPGRRLQLSEIGPCPAAPRKQKSLPLKRKWTPDQTNSTRPTAYRLLDFTKEIESMYPPLLQANLGRKIKKARSV